MSSMTNDNFLQILGWDNKCEIFWKELGLADLRPARIIGQEKTLYRAQFSKDVILPANITGKIWYDQGSTLDLPAVGDWVACSLGSTHEPAQIQHIFPRKTTLQRKHPGTVPIMQIIATNVDYMFIATSLNEDFNIRRIERYLGVALEAGTKPILLLTKSDLSNNQQEILKSLNQEFSGLKIHVLSHEDPDSMEALKPYFEIGMTSVLVGSSGVGKSTIVNFLSGSDSQKTQKVSHESKGRHTTTSRNLIFTRWGGLIIDTPGMKEIAQLEDQNTQIDFSDVEEIFLKCKFSDCKHQTEPGCAITRALKDKSLSEDRWNSYKLKYIQGKQFTKKSRKQK